MEVAGKDLDCRQASTGAKVVLCVPFVALRSQGSRQQRPLVVHDEQREEGPQGPVANVLFEQQPRVPGGEVADRFSADQHHRLAEAASGVPQVKDAALLDAGVAVLRDVGTVTDDDVGPLPVPGGLVGHQ
eukprot:EG_transcript_31689